ncbi:MATE family efflux transporter [Aestuariispira ectoiniformans]|uniref:MATE family efflux transporter n=1 Tax=Aestuariispira ectoiniformans TaxID=2775080 RepID=UPI00223BD500|nr:MATE family efflux transporter [Aestuariispira ectoiniformans]
MDINETIIERAPGRIKRHLNEFLRLATPVIASRAGLLLLTAVDTAMLGHMAPEEVAGYTLGTSPFIVLMVFGVGLMMGTLIATAHSDSSDNAAEVGRVWKQSIPYAALVGLALGGLSFFGEAYFSWTRPAAELVQTCINVFLLQGLGLLPAMLFTTTTFFLEGLRRPYPVLFAIALGNLANIIINPLFIYGLWGLPEMGAEGAALATAIARWTMAIGIIAYVWWLKDHHALGIRQKLPKGWWQQSRQQRRYGYAAGLSYGFETFAFGVMAIYAGWLGTEASAIYGVCMNMLAMIFMSALGFATATSVRVGIAHGRRDWPDRALAGWTGLAATWAIMGLCAMALWTVPETVIGIYLTDEHLITLALPSIALIGFIMFGDGGQIVMAQALRGAADTWIPTAMNFVSYMMVMIPCGYLFTQVLDHGVFGLFEAIAVGSAVSVTVVTSRWTWLCIKPKRSLP